MPAVPDISVQNLRDGTAKVVVSGADSDASISVQMVRIDNQWPVNEWSGGVTRIGDGEIIVPSGPGVFWFSARSAVGADSSWSIPRYAAISDGSPDMFDQVIDAVVARLQLLMLDGIDASRVIPHLLLTPDYVKTLNENCILVGQLDGEQPLPGGPTTRDRYGYRVVIALAAPANRDQERRTIWNKWREFILHAFNSQWLVTATGSVAIGTFLPVSGPIRSYWEKNCYASMIGFEFMSEEFRGMRV